MPATPATARPSAPPAAEQPPLTLTVGVLFLVMFTVASQFLIVAPVLPRIGEVLVVEDRWLGMLVSGYGAAVAVFAIVAGPVSDRVGRRAILRFGSAWMAVALLLHGLADSFASLLLLRVLAGAGSGIMSGAAVAYLGDLLPYHQRGRAIGWVMSGMALGQILGVPLGTVLAGWYGYQTPFVAFGLVMILAFAGTMGVLAPTHTERSKTLTLVSGLRQYAAILRHPPLVAIAVASTTMMLSVSSYIVYLPAWLEQTLGATPEQVAVMFLVGGIANAGMGPVAGRLSDSIGRKGLVVGSSVALAAVMGVTILLPSVGWAYPLFFVTMLTVGARISPINAWMTALVDDHQRGTLLSLTMATGQAGFAIGAAAAGWTYVAFGYGSNTALAAIGALCTAAILGFFVPEPALVED